ncbi:MAG: aminomethyl-transferring glycine dehydrogenase subunit GcvPA [Elusimicrobiaceae bacterium]|nr:aminomethyl-transferring glycine dehydrogenase subunit GcvPA [Elusimicrobiaceae bacterium]
MFSPHTTKQREEMLKAIGVSSVEELTAQVPAELLNPAYNLPPALTEQELVEHVTRLSAKNTPLACFAGAGAYDHYIPSAIRHIVQRGEFLTAYTPYQAEASQGMLQAIYEFQSSICALFEMDAANASMYEGATALAEAVNAAVRITGRKKILLTGALHPEYKATLKTYFGVTGAAVFADIPCAGGQMDMAALDSMLGGDTAAVVLATPNFYGVIEDAQAVSDKAHSCGALLVATVNPVSLGVLAAPGSYGADIAVAEGQGLGNPMSAGGPYLGIFACKKEHMRHMPGRICGLTKDHNGRRGFVLTLQAREQHIRRERAASNICSNEALCALSATIHLALLGPAGLKEAAELCVEKAHRLAALLSAAPGFSVKYSGPYFNEFVLECPVPAEKVRSRLLKKGILAGVPLGNFDKSMKNCLLVCATEKRTDEEMRQFAAELGRFSK